MRKSKHLKGQLWPRVSHEKCALSHSILCHEGQLFHGYLWFQVYFSLLQVGFHSFSWFEVGFSWFQVGCNGFSWFQVGFSWFLVSFHGSWSVYFFFMVPGWFFMVPGWLSWFFMVPGWFFMVPGRFFMVFLQNVPAQTVSWPDETV